MGSWKPVKFEFSRKEQIMQEKSSILTRIHRQDLSIEIFNGVTESRYQKIYEDFDFWPWADIMIYEIKYPSSSSNYKRRLVLVDQVFESKEKFVLF